VAYSRLVKRGLNDPESCGNLKHRLALTITVCRAFMNEEGDSYVGLG